MESDIKVGDILMLKNGVTLEVYECDLNENCKCSKGECYYKNVKIYFVLYVIIQLDFLMVKQNQNLYSHLLQDF